MPTQPRLVDDSESSLAELAVAARDSDAAREALVRATRGEVRRFAVAFVGPDAADDVTQETFIRALASLHRYDPERPFFPWLITVAKHAALDHLRAGRRRVALLDRMRREPQAAAVWGAAGDVAELIRGLDPERRLAFVLTQVLGFEYAEAARVARVPVGTIRSRVHRARSELIAVLAEG